MKLNISKSLKSKIFTLLVFYLITLLIIPTYTNRSKNMKFTQVNYRDQFEQVFKIKNYKIKVSKRL